MVLSVNSQSSPLVSRSSSVAGLKEPLVNPTMPDDTSINRYQDTVTITGVKEKPPVYEPMTGGGTTQPDPKIQQTE